MSNQTSIQEASMTSRLGQLLADQAALDEASSFRLAGDSARISMGQLLRQTVTESDQAQLERLLSQWIARRSVGWIETTGAVHEIDGQAGLPALQGRVLSADLADPAGMGFRVRSAPGKRWTATTLSVGAGTDVQSDAVLLHEVRHASVRHPLERLVYRVASNLDATGSLCVVDAWFIGFAVERAD